MSHDSSGVLTVHDVHHDRSRIGVRRRTRILPRVIHVHVSYQQIVRESLSVLGELRQSRLRLEAQNLQWTLSVELLQITKRVN